MSCNTQHQPEARRRTANRPWASPRATRHSSVLTPLPFGNQRRDVHGDFPCEPGDRHRLQGPRAPPGRSRRPSIARPKARCGSSPPLPTLGLAAHEARDGRLGEGGLGKPCANLDGAGGARGDGAARLEGPLACRRGGAKEARLLAATALDQKPSARLRRGGCAPHLDDALSGLEVEHTRRDAQHDLRLRGLRALAASLV